MDCSICISTLKEPVSLPCGHVFCDKCLEEHILNQNESSDEESDDEEDKVSVDCPLCRTHFALATPDRRYVSQKYRPFINPAIRRVYVDSAATTKLQGTLTAAEDRTRTLEADNKMLMRRCESNMAAARQHRNGEAQARQDKEAARREVRTLTARLELAERRGAEVQARYDNLANGLRDLGSKAEQSSRSQLQQKLPSQVNRRPVSPMLLRSTRRKEPSGSGVGVVSHKRKAAELSSDSETGSSSDSESEDEDEDEDGVDSDSSEDSVQLIQPVIRSSRQRNSLRGDEERLSQRRRVVYTLDSD